MLLQISVYDSIMPRKGYYYILFSKIFDTDKDNLQQEFDRLFEYAEKINIRIIKTEFPTIILVANNSKLELD